MILKKQKYTNHGLSHKTIHFYAAAILWLIFSIIPATLSADPAENKNKPIETPANFVNRKVANYKAGTDALQQQYDLFCDLGGGKKPGAPQPPAPPGAPPQPPPLLPPQPPAQPPGGQLPGGPKVIQVETPGLGNEPPVVDIEIEQVITAWSALKDGETGTNPFSWDQVQKAFLPASGNDDNKPPSPTPEPTPPAPEPEPPAPEPTPPPSSSDNCTGSSIALSSGGMAFIVADPENKSCRLSTSSAGASVYISNSGTGIFYFGVADSSSGWSGSSGQAAYNSAVTASFLKGGSMMSVTFMLSSGPPYIFQVTSVKWQ